MQRKLKKYEWVISNHKVMSLYFVYKCTMPVINLFN